MSEKIFSKINFRINFTENISVATSQNKKSHLTRFDLKANTF
jgi:hypothetical protein